MLEQYSSSSRLLQTNETPFTFYCPRPLVYSEPADNDDYYTIWALESQGCASPCPSLTYTSAEWQLLVDILLGVSSVCLLAAVVSTIIISTDVKKFYVKLMFTLGFLCFSLVSVIFFSINLDNEVICRGAAHFYRTAPFCIFQAAIMVFFFIWIQIWGIFLSLETYFFFLGKASQKTIQWCRQYYTIISFVLPSLLTVIPLASGNYGFDPYANLPVCLFLFHDEKKYFWFGLFLPFLLLNFICSVITIFSIMRINQIFVSVKQLKHMKSTSTTTSGGRKLFSREHSVSDDGYESSVLQASLVSS